MRKNYFLFLLFLLAHEIDAQFLMGFHTEYNDSFRSWEIEAEIDSSTILEGELGLTWGMDNDFTSWNYSVGDYYGEISQKWNNNPELWQLRQEGVVVIMKTQWPGDIRSWKISSDTNSIIIQTRFGNFVDDWYIKTDDGEFEVFTGEVGDPRSWIVNDYMPDHITFPMRMAAAFIAIYSSIPKP